MEAYLIQITNYFQTQSWQIAVLVTVVAIMNLVLRNRSAHVRYLLWLIVLAKCLVPPVLTVPLAVLPQDKSVTSPIFERTVAPEVMPVSVPSTPVRPAPPVRTVAPRPERLTPRQWLGLAWIIGVVAFVLIAEIKAMRTHFWLIRKRKPLLIELQAGFEDLFYDLGLKKFPKVWLVEGIGQPFVWGLLRGGIYLPANFVKVNSAEHRRGVLGHELSHVLRFDAAVNLLQIIAQALFWFHPFVWWANRRIRAEREKCCDEMAIARLNAHVRDYGKAIVDTLVTEYESTRPVPSLAVAGPVRNIEERIKTMLRPGKQFYKHPSLPAVAIVVLMALLAVPTAVVLTARAGTAPGFGNPTNLGPSVNSSAHEYDPSISADELELYFNSYRSGGLGQADIWVTTRKTKVDPWSTPVNLGLTVNSPAGELAPSISADGLSLYFSSDRSGGYGVQDLWVTTRETKRAPWGEPVNLGPTVNSAAREHAPSISTDGLELYFSGLWEFPESSRPGGSGGSDIWVTTRKTKRDPWGTPVNLGPTVNSSTYDESPSISGDGLSLYFYSHRSGGSGKSDIWVTRRKSTSDPWSAPMNLGPTVNSVNMEGNPDISRDGYTLYFASRRPGGSGGSDLWQVSLKTQGEKEDSSAGQESSTPTKPLHQAAAAGDIEQVRSLISKGANVNVKDEKGQTPLHLAARYAHLNVAGALVANGADVNAKNADDWTPLHVVAWYDNYGYVAKVLLSKNADTNAKDKSGQTPLHRAIVLGHQNVTRLLIDSGANVNVRDVDGQTPLHYCGMYGERDSQEDVIDLLVSRGANVNAKDKSAQTPLHKAAAEGHENLVEKLIAEGANINTKAEGGRTPLHAAASNGSDKVVESLIAKGADINTRANKGMTPLHEAATNGHKGVVELLVAKGADVSAKTETGDTAASMALGAHHLEVVDMLIAKGSDVPPMHSVYLSTQKGNLAETKRYMEGGIGVSPDGKARPPLLHVAALAGHKDMVDLIIANGADVNAKDLRGNVPLHYAASGGHKDATELLVARGADVNARGKWGATPLHEAIDEGHLNIVEVLLARGADVNAKDRWGTTPLRMASFQEDDTIAKLLIRAGADVNARNMCGSTPLIGAARGYRKVAELLIKEGAEVNAGNDFGETPMHYVVWNDTKEVAELLLDNGANPNAQATGAWAPLHYATGSADMTTLLLRKGADPNVKTGEGATPLLMSAGEGNKRVVELLVSHGADVNARDNDGQTPSWLARQNGHNEIVELLRKHGAKE